jgi:dolichol-phosphate mannosyltransferase
MTELESTITILSAPNSDSMISSPMNNELLSTSNKNLAIIIPTFNESESIGPLIDELISLRYSINSIIVVDGHSTDGTAEIAKAKGAIVIFQPNKGYGDALRTGFIYAKNKLHSDILVMIDGDSSYDTKDIQKLINPILQNSADMVIGNRFEKMHKKSMPLMNRIGNKIISWFAKIALKINIHDTQCGIRAFKAQLLDSFNFDSEGMSMAIEMLSDTKYAGGRICEVSVSYRKRKGETKLNPIQDGAKIFLTMLRLMRDTRPILFFGLFALFFFIIGSVLGIDVLIEYILTGTVTRIPTAILSSLLILSSIQFFILGLVADMIYKFSRRRISPLYKY